MRTNNMKEKELRLQKMENKNLNSVAIKPCFFSLNDEKFKAKWLFRYGFWRIVYFGIIAKFGIVTVNRKPVNGIYISFGTAEPLPDLLCAGYSTSLTGYVFWEPILQYLLSE